MDMVTEPVNGTALQEACLEVLQRAKAEAESDTKARPAASANRPAPKSSRAISGSDNSKKAARKFWLKQLHAWHWISAAISLTAMFMFSITGLTLNHAATIGSEPKVETIQAQLKPGSLQALSAGPATAALTAATPLPVAIADEVQQLVGISAQGVSAEWSEAEVYVAVPGPGRDAWVSIDRTTGRIEAEKTDRGWISFLNDLHKGRNTGTAWFWFIDVLAIACVVFTFTGLLLLQLHARNRPSTWPLVGFGTAIPLIVILFFMHA